MSGTPVKLYREQESVVRTFYHQFDPPNNDDAGYHT